MLRLVYRKLSSEIRRGHGARRAQVVAGERTMAHVRRGVEGVGKGSLMGEWKGIVDGV